MKPHRHMQNAFWVALALGAAPLAHAQSAVVGSLGNFDAANYEGRNAYGFEVEIEGIQAKDLAPSWCGNKFGCPKIYSTATGVLVRYESAYDATRQAFVSATVPHAPGTAFAGTCYMGSAAYANSGCDHFGVRFLYTAPSTAITRGYRWLFADAANPGQLVASTNNIFVPTPVYSWVPPANPGLPPVLVVEVNAPPPPPPVPAVPPQFGDATWMKVFKREMPREVALDELVTDGAVVPQDPAEIETDWVLLQPEPPSDGNRRRRNRHANSGNVNGTTRAVVRRYETYAYTGAYDPVTHEVVCGGDGLCNAPVDGELGDLINAQMAAANVAVPSVNVTVVGGGLVSSTDRIISCGNKCSGSYALDTQVTLTQKADSNSTFAGWGGDCAGTAASCTVTVADAMNVQATFTANAPRGGGGGGGGGTASSFTLQVGRSNTGDVTATPAGLDRALNCGSDCSAKFAAGTAVTLTATPRAGKTFLNWTGACTGSAPQCTVTMTGNFSVQPVFSR